jgi:hypothetical protein
MKAAPEDRLESRSGSGGGPFLKIVLVVAILVGAWLLWDTWQQPEPIATQVETAEEVVVQTAELPPAEDIPRPAAPVTEAAGEITEPAAPPLPPLEESDPLMREQLAAAGMGPELDQMEAEENLVQLGTALIDGFSRGVVQYKLLPVKRPSQPFGVELRGQQLYMDPAGYARYDEYAEAIASLDTEALVGSFHRMRPLYEQAYAQLGLDPEGFDNAVIRMLDHVLQTPEIDEPIELNRKSVMYQYADPQLEQLSPVQKQLLRMGPQNLRRIKEQALALRAGLLSQP